MKIAYLLHEVLPAHKANTEQVVRTAAALAACGASVDLFFPGTKRPPEESAREISAFYGLGGEGLNGVRLIEGAVPTVFKDSTRGILHHLSVIPQLDPQAYDVVYIRDIAALWLGLRAKIPTLFETYRVNINTRRRYGLWRRLNYRHPDLLGVVTHSRLARKGFLRAGLPEDRVLVVYNGFDPASLRPALDTGEAREELGIESSRPLVVYAGRIGPHKGTDILVRIAAHLPEVDFLIVGAEIDSPEHATLLHLMDQEGVRNLSVRGQVTPAEVPAFLFAADCLIMPPSSRPLEIHGRTVLPIKTFNYLAAGRPIVAGDLPDVGEVLVDERNAVLTPPDRPRAAAKALRELLADRDRMARLSAASLEDVQSYTWDARGRRVHRYIERLLAGR